MIAPPHYFQEVRNEAAADWNLLDNNPRISGPWHTLFSQVKSPRHVLSELLQNADDAGATEASVRLDEGHFVFTHNGEDFSEEHFASLCAFGRSCKRTMHTIGFRGIGFKSTFSLGDTVELRSPTLSVAFDHERFTEPRWIDREPSSRAQTTIRVALKDERPTSELAKNLDEWLANPLSLLFFRHIRQLTICDREIRWESVRPGPSAATEWVSFHHSPGDEYLIARSQPEPLPADALAEVKKERLLLPDADEADFPPCTVEIVLGASGQLYVVLPTGVNTQLLFACNAPFIQSPARLNVRAPGDSPTNEWLLKRVGALSASVMLAWLRDSSASVADRSKAYTLVPDLARDETSLEGTCAAIVQKAFWNAVGEQPFLLTDDGQLKSKKQSVVIPKELFDVWSPAQVTALLDDESRPAFSRHVSAADLLPQCSACPLAAR